MTTPPTIASMAGPRTVALSAAAVIRLAPVLAAGLEALRADEGTEDPSPVTVTVVQDLLDVARTIRRLQRQADGAPMASLPPASARISVKEAAELLGTSPRQVVRRREEFAGRQPGGPGTRWLLDRQLVEDVVRDTAAAERPS